MTTMTISLPDERIEQLQQLAQEAGIAPEELVLAHIETWLTTDNERIEQAGEYVLNKNRELYRRLA